MNLFEFQTLRGKMSVYAVLAVSFILIFKSFYSIELNIDANKADVESSFLRTMTLTAAAVSPALWDYSVSNLSEVMDTALADANVVRIEITDEHGALIIAKEKVGYPTGNGQFNQKERRLYAKGKYIGNLRMTLSDHLEKLKLYQSILIELIFALLELVAIGLVLSRLAKRMTNPITEMVHIAEQIAKGHLNNSFSKHSTDELGRLSKSLESMQTQIFEQINSLENDRTEISALYEETAAMNEELEYMLDRVNGSYEGTIKSLANAIEASDEYTKGHCERVEQLALQIAGAMDLSPTRLDTLSKAAILHDIGKIGVPSSILNKEETLTQLEFEAIKKHSWLGYQILKEVEFLKDSNRIILQHHERYDGTGYPEGLSGNQIDLMARILSVADAYDAMTSSRAYRKTPLSHESALIQLRGGSGKQFDPEVVAAFERSLGCEEA